MLKGNKILYLIFFVLLAVTIGEIAYYFFFKPAPPQQVQPQEPQQIITEPTTSQTQIGTQTTATSIPPKEFLSNSKSYYMRQPFDKKIVEVKGDFKVDLDMKIEIQKDTPVGHSNGLVISNNEVGADLRELTLNYQYGGWNLAYYISDKQEFFEGLFDDKNLELAGKFSLKIDKEGKKVTVTLPNNQEKSFDLKESFYPLENTVTLKIQVAPLSKVIVSHLSYQEF